jgi:hypothetical protein
VAHANLTALSGLTGAADRLPYFTGAGALSLATLTSLARNLLDDTTQLGMQSTLGLVKQTGVNDTTADSLLTVGAGIAALSADVAPKNAPVFTGTGTFNGGLIANVNGGVFEVGRADGVAGGGYIDFHSGATVVDHDARIAVTGGTGVTAQANMLITAGSLSYANAPTSGSHLVNKTYSDNASNLLTGTVPDARIAGSYTGMTNLTGSGTVDFAKFAGVGTDTAAAPSYTWTGDTNTGMYSPAADQIAFSTGGVQRLLINSLGLTAVGTELTALDATNITLGTIAAARVATLDQNTTGSAATLTTARTIALSGEVTGTATSFDGGANISIATTITDTGWLTPTLVNSFAQVAATPLRYRKVGNVVFVQGAVSRTSNPPAGTQITTLPVGFRPDSSLLNTAVWFDASFNSQLHTPIIATTGAVQNGFTYPLSTTAPSGGGTIQLDFSYTV